MTETPHRYEPIAVSDESTVVAEYTADPTTATAHQSEAELEQSFINQLRKQAYEYVPITSNDELVANLRAQLETLNDLTFSDAEWDDFFTTCIASANDSIADKTHRIHDDYIQLLTRDDGTTKNITLIDKANIHNNRLQVINQYEAQGNHANRYDVTVLVNGLPMVHIELKRRGVDIREAFNQIDRYQRDSFWADTGIFQYVQLFVISNGTLTKYYSNTTRDTHITERAGKRRSKQTSNSFAFTSWWADATNKPIEDLIGFAKTFFAKHTLLSILTRYCVLTEERLLLVMRPYQIVATERILRRIDTSTTYKQWGSTKAGGYIWHTTGSGKTLTSFKVAQLASRLESVDKVLFVVDRKDLDYQTMKEYDRFEKGAANSNSSTRVLTQQLGNPNANIIVTTIQKLSRFVETNQHHPVYDQHTVIIFDECHRSQFGEMHTAITKAFNRYHLFGFTGTPIFAENSSSGGNPNLRTTEQAFGDKLHTYTIVDAITDKNVLPFRIDYINTIKMPDHVDDTEVSAIDTEAALLAVERQRQVVAYILEHFNQKTKRSERYRVHGRSIRGFNSIFATASIEAAKRYYNQFYTQQQQLAAHERLKVAMIYSYAPNPDVETDLLAEEDFDADELTIDDRSFLDDAIADYNDMFATSFSTSSDQFENYYKDLSKRLREQQIDIVIVVNMFLTGFDATTLNTLWVDKNLRSHGLVQAFSRTNRILNSVKTYGNIVCFRDLEQRTNDALALFGNKDARGIVLLKPYSEYYDEYADKVTDLLNTFPAGEQIIGEQAQRDFVVLFGAILRLRNILQSFDDFAGNEILSERQMQDYQSVYLNVHADLRGDSDDKENINDDLVFEIELIKQVEINVDYILMLVEQFREAKGDGDDTEIRAAIDSAIGASPSLRNKRDLIEAFVDSLSATAEVTDAWSAFIEQRRAAELAEIIADENLDQAKTQAIVERALADGELQTTGTAFTRILPRLSRFGTDASYGETKEQVVMKLRAFIERFVNLG